jgi:hypothetical protein
VYGQLFYWRSKQYHSLRLFFTFNWNSQSDTEKYLAMSGTETSSDIFIHNPPIKADWEASSSAENAGKSSEPERRVKKMYLSQPASALGRNQWRNMLGGKKQETPPAPRKSKAMRLN